MVKQNNKNEPQCMFCQKITKGGIHRAKQHIAGGFRNTTARKKCPPHVRDEIRNYMEAKSAKNDISVQNLEDEADEVDVIEGRPVNKRAKKQPLNLGPINTYFSRTPGPMQGKKEQQSTLNAALKKEDRNKVCLAISNWMYDAAIPFNAVNYPSFQEAVDLIASFGLGLKAPSYHEVRVPFLQKSVEYINDNYIMSCKEEWAKNGCSLMLDGWTDKRQRTLINFLVNSPKGLVFLESIDASAYSKTGLKMFELMDKFVELVGEENVVQVVTDNASNNVAAGKLLQAQRPHLFWTLCAAHCIDLILEDIGKLSTFKDTLKKAISLNGYIYVRPGVVEMLRRFTNKKELVRSGTTRFATAYLTLERLHTLKHSIRKMFMSEEWNESKWSKEAEGKRIQKIVLAWRFWSDILYILKIYGHLFCVLRLVDGEKKPAMGYIYEAMDRSKETIIKSFNGDESNYKEVFKIIDNRWELHHPLHAAGFLLNPQFYYTLKEEIDGEVNSGFIDAMERIVRYSDEQDKIINQLPLYKNAEGLFGKISAIRQRSTLSPAQWWETFGGGAPQLKKFAIRILSLTCSSSGCERNWSIFEHVHSKKRNRLDQKRLNDLVYVKYNRALKARYDARDRIDPILLRSIDDSNEWLRGVMEDEDQNGENELVFENDVLTTWGLIGNAMGVDEPAYPTRGQKQKSIAVAQKASASGSKQVSKRKEKSVMEKRKGPCLGLVDEDDDFPETDESENEVFEEGDGTYEDVSDNETNMDYSDGNEDY